ncbi:MAG: OmpA family protein [Alphaproteobacteria bacterium]|nr:OmpA family protein [Alphaproteobacteria bacterium]MCL2505066.1 OmpA family protein [Alphaproteobacteria bacterium]
MINTKTLLKTAFLGTVLTLGSFGTSFAADRTGCLRTQENEIVKTKEMVPVFAGTDNCLASCPEVVLPSITTVYFDFDSAALSKSAKKVLTVLKHKLSKAPAADVTIVGFADRLGNPAHNEALALRRAAAVKTFLASHGLSAKTTVRYLGGHNAKANCSDTLPRAELIACLRIDRRVEIEIR